VVAGPTVSCTGAPGATAAAPAGLGSRPRRSRFRLLVFTLLVTALVGGGTYGGLLNPDGGTQVVREPAGTPGSDPFMPPPGPDGTVQPQVRNLNAATAGDQPGLYGGTRTESCDTDRIAGFLATHPAQARAWADALGIAPGDIDGFLATLTPVVLRADTAVTNHGFRGGLANQIDSVLEAGTGVLVDPHGVPRVRCYCGNPLGPPAPDTAQSTGVVTVQPSAQPVSHFVVVESGSDRVVARPPGTRGDRDRPATDDETSRARAVVQDSSTQDDATDDDAGGAGDGVAGGGFTGGAGTGGLAPPTPTDEPATGPATDAPIVLEAPPADGTVAPAPGVDPGSADPGGGQGGDTGGTGTSTGTATGGTATTGGAVGGPGASGGGSVAPDLGAGPTNGP
jgi:hypothetical protein